MTTHEHEDGTARGVLAIVLVGIALGVGFNWLGLGSRAEWGLPWIGVDKVASLPVLEAAHGSWISSGSSPSSFCSAARTDTEARRSAAP